MRIKSQIQKAYVIMPSRLQSHASIKATSFNVSIPSMLSNSTTKFWITKSTKAKKHKSSSCGGGKKTIVVPKPKKSVTFCDDEEKEQVVGETLSALDYTPQEKQASWYNDFELNTMRMEAKLFVMDMEINGIDTKSAASITELVTNPTTEDGNSMCYLRGLEHRTKSGSQRRLQSRYKSRSIVLKEQERQRYMGDYDPSYIAYIYSLECESSVSLAREVAMRDARVASFVAHAD